MPSLSPTKISMYLACRAMYRYTYIEKISRFYYRPKAYHSFGASLHRTLDEFHSLGGPEVQSPERLVETLHTAWTSQGYATKEEEAQRLQDATELLQQYHTECVVPGVVTLFSEKQLKYDMGEFNLIGRLDRLDQHPDGRLEVVDYKSGRMSVSEEEIRNDLAMQIYALLVAKHNPESIVSASIYCLRSGQKAIAEFGIAELSEIEFAVREIGLEIIQMDLESVVEPEWQPYACPNCDYLRLCARRGRWDVASLTQEATEN